MEPKQRVARQVKVRRELYSPHGRLLEISIQWRGGDRLLNFAEWNFAKRAGGSNLFGWDGDTRSRGHGWRNPLKDAFRPTFNFGAFAVEQLVRRIDRYS